MKMVKLKRPKEIGCWFCGEAISLPNRLSITTEAYCKGGKCLRENKLYWKPIEFETVTCPECGEEHEATSVFQLSIKPADYNYVLDRLHNVRLVDTKEWLEEIARISKLHSVVEYSNELFNHIINGELGTLYDQVIVNDSLSNRENLKELILEAWKGRDEDK